MCNYHANKFFNSLNWRLAAPSVTNLQPLYSPQKKTSLPTSFYAWNIINEVFLHIPSVDALMFSCQLIIIKLLTFNCIMVAAEILCPASCNPFTLLKAKVLLCAFIKDFLRVFCFCVCKKFHFKSQPQKNNNQGLIMQKREKKKQNCNKAY